MKMLYEINDPEFIARVTKGIPIEELEDRLKSRVIRSRSGKIFLGKDESLLKVVHDDEEKVRNLGVTHDQIADRVIWLIDAFGPPDHRAKVIDTPYNTYKVIGDAYVLGEICPWEDSRPPSYSDFEFNVTNVRLNEDLYFTTLISHLIREHHFYLGRQSPYRVDPARAVRVLDLK